MELLSGAHMLIRSLQDEGIEYIYGYPGGAALHIYDALFRQDKVKHSLVRHEQAATHAADGYAPLPLWTPSPWWSCAVRWHPH